MMITTATLKLDSADDYLGPAETRFFGSGYRRTNPRLRSIRIKHEGEGSTLLAQGGIDLDHRWSIKAGTAQRPHLSTPDIIALAVTAAEVILASALSPAALARCHVETMTIKAGGEPLESGLEAFAVEARGRMTGNAALIDVTLPGFTVDLIVHRPLGVPSFARLSSDTPDALVGPPDRRVYAGTYAARSPRIGDITVDRAGHRALASARLPACEASAGIVGIESEQQPRMNLIDVFVVTLQLGQILLYEFDGLPRTDSNTLWMRRTQLVSSPNRAPVDGGLCEVSLDRARILRMDGERWRAADIVGSLDGITVTCGVAHRLQSGGNSA